MPRLFKQVTYGQEIDGWRSHAARVAEIAKRLPQRASEAAQSLAIADEVEAQMRRKGKRRQSAFWGLERT